MVPILKVLKKTLLLLAKKMGLMKAIMKKDILGFGKQFCKSFEAQTAMFPNMLNDEVLKTIEENKASVLGWKLSGAGGGGYLVFVSENEIPETLKIRIRR